MPTLILRSLRYYWRTNLAVIAGVAAAVAVLAGALLVGASVRESLRDIALQRLGQTGYVATSAHFFREQLATETSGTPLIVLEGTVSNPATHRRASGVAVYGIDDRFWQFNKWTAESGALITNGLAAETGDGELLLRLDKPSAIPKESLHGRKDEGKTVRLTTTRTAHQFSLKPQQGEMLAIYVPLRRLQRELALTGKVNTLLFATTPPDVASKFTLDDLGIRIRSLDQALSVESDTAIVSDSLAAAAGPAAEPVFSYLANAIRVNQREVPYSLVTAVDRRMLDIPAGTVDLNDWAASELNAHPGDAATFDYYFWADGGNLVTRTASFKVHSILPIRGLAADRDLTPEYPGITSASSIRDWDPPFPMDLGRIRPVDEAYWNKYRTTPKAFISIEDGQKLWGSRFGRITSLRLPAGDPQQLAHDLRSHIDPAKFGLTVYPARASALEGARGSTDFGEYFTYFSFFLVASAALLAALFFRLGIEQRLREIGTLRAIGWPLRKVRTILLGEGTVLAIAGAILGSLGAIAYCAFVLYGLSTWWRGAVGTSALKFHLDPLSLATGAVSGFAIAVIVIWLSLRAFSKIAAVQLLAGQAATRTTKPPSRWSLYAAILPALAAAALIAAALAKSIDASGAFFGAGTLLLIAALTGISIRLRSSRKGLERSQTLWSLGTRNASFRPGRSLLCIALIASAVFLLVALDAFRQTGTADTGPHSGTGGFPLLAESQLPILWDPNSPAGREGLNLSSIAANLKDVRFYAFRLRPGEDASCLNLYEPRNPRVLGAPSAFIQANRFAFTDSKQSNPWLLLNDPSSPEIPAIADANSITYVLHKKIGDTIEVGGAKLKIVAALSGSLLQSELIISENRFVRAFPEEQGYRFFLIDAPTAAIGDTLEESLSDFGFDATPTETRLAGYHRVENTYLSTFQALGALGLLLGTIGLAAVLLRNVLERRRELAVLVALGYQRNQINQVVLAENAWLVAAGLVIGAVCALLAVLPAALQHGGAPPLRALGLLLITVPLTALISTYVAIRAVQHTPVLESLRSE